MSLKKITFVGNKCIMRTEGDVCKTTKELLSSELFAEVVVKFVKHLQKHDSVLLAVFGEQVINRETINYLIKTLRILGDVYIGQTTSLFPESRYFVTNPEVLNDFVEGLYNYWRGFERVLILVGNTDCPEGRSHRAFNDTVERFNDLVRSAYRDIQENITGEYCNVYRQVCAGAQIGLIASRKDWPCLSGQYAKLRNIPIISQVLLNPPLIIDPPTNKRDGEFQKVGTNPLDGWTVRNGEWFCYPAKVGPLLVHNFFHQTFMELGCSLANLFELARGRDLKRKPDAIFAYGVPKRAMCKYGNLPTVFFDDRKNDILVGAIPAEPRFGYFGYLKKMALTLHNVVMMKRGKMPFHGALVHIVLKKGGKATVLLMGDTGAGKSETLEALRTLSEGNIRNMVVIADDMGSVEIDSSRGLVGYGTETGAFVRLDDLHSGYAFGQMDRAVVMSPQKKNARIVVPITKIANVLKGYPVNFMLYANNYEQVDTDHPIIEQFHSSEDAIRVFRDGNVMAKGTTTSVGLGHAYFANVFGPSQYRDLHDKIAARYFEAAFEKKVFVGQIRTRLGIVGWESKGPEEGAKKLFELISSRQK